LSGARVRVALVAFVMNRRASGTLIRAAKMLRRLRRSVPCIGAEMQAPGIERRLASALWRGLATQPRYSASP